LTYSKRGSTVSHNYSKDCIPLHPQYYSTKTDQLEHQEGNWKKCHIWLALVQQLLTPEFWDDQITIDLAG